MHTSVVFSCKLFRVKLLNTFCECEFRGMGMARTADVKDDAAELQVILFLSLLFATFSGTGGKGVCRRSNDVFKALVHI